MDRRENRRGRIFGDGILWFLGIAAGIGLGLTGCHRAPSLTPRETEGKHLYSVRCAHCHEDNDLALKKVPPDLHDVFRRTTLPSGALATDAEVKRVVLSGKGMMPSFAGRFSDDQINDLLAYLHTGLR
jgi:mono/diheme cytochrome c family protein